MYEQIWIGEIVTMTAECFLVEAISEYSKKQDVQKSQRFPQFLFNKLADKKPKIANELLGSMYDFYYDDKLLEWKWEKVSYWWDKEEYK